MNNRELYEEEWIAKYRAAMRAFSEQQENSRSLRSFFNHLKERVRRADPPSAPTMRPVPVPSTAKSPQRHGTQHKKTA